MILTGMGSYPRVGDTPELQRFLAGKRVMMSGNWSMYHEMAEAGRQRGVNGSFAPDSLFLCAGGTKGATLPYGYR